jgi:hypothetical protein
MRADRVKRQRPMWLERRGAFVAKAAASLGSFEQSNQFESHLLSPAHSPPENKE